MVAQMLERNPEKLTQIRLIGDCSHTDQISWEEIMLFSVDSLTLSVVGVCAVQDLCVSSSEWKLIARWRLLTQFWRLINRRSPASFWTSSTSTECGLASTRKAPHCLASLASAAKPGLVLTLEGVCLRVREYRGEEEIDESPEGGQEAWNSIYNS